MNVTGLSKWFGLYSFTRLHRQIELFLNGVCDGDWPVEMVEFFNFLTVEIIPRGWKPYRTEWSIFDENHLVAGQIDSVWIDSNTGSLHMIDWKRCAKPLDPDDGNRFNRFGRAPCEFLLDNSFCHYAVQQNLYAAILRDCYGLTLGSMWLVQLHSDLPSYRFIPVPAFLDIAAVLLQRSAPVIGSHPLDRLGGVGESQSTQERGFEQLLEEEEAEASLQLADSMQFAAAMQDTVSAAGPWASGPEEVTAAAADQATHSRRADIPGSKTSNMDFDRLFDACSAGADTTLSTAEADVEKGRSSIQERTRDLTEMVTARHRAMLKE